VLIADLPCSGLGIMGRKTDIKYHASKESLMQLQSLQRQILSVVWQYVKPGGTLIYSTCTVNSGENEENIRWFTEKYPFHTESLSPYLPEKLKEEGKEGMLQLLPGIHETDGFFLARLIREE
ncbi:MAG: 16S rRNA (cytosine(967)-C(5))-methyltransferase, partial [Suilimivivens sp.]